MLDNKCSECNAPAGRIHATNCSQRQIVSDVESSLNSQIGYTDSKNKRSFADGMQFQDFVVEKFNEWGFYIQLYASRLYQLQRGESVQRVEIKLDKGCFKYGHLSIETAERKNLSSQWVHSGIYRPDSVFYVQGNEDVLYMFLRRDLVRWHEAIGSVFDEPLPTIRRFFIDLPDADELCIAKWGEEGWTSK